MTRTSDLESWINVAKLGVAAGELAPFPYIKGLCGCTVVVLETIEKAGKNNEDLLDLADSIQKTIEMVQSTVKEHGESSALRFRDICAELEVYLTDLTFELNSTRRKSRGIKRFLKAKNVSDAITGYRERVRTIKEDFLIHTAVDSRLVISDIKDGLRTSTEALTSAIETSQRQTISKIDKRVDNICEEISTWGISQGKKADQLSADIQALTERGLYKGLIRDVPLGDIHLKDLLPPSEYLKPWNRFTTFDDYNAEVENSNAPKIIRVYRSHRDSNKIDDVMKQFHTDIDRLINLKHPHVAQIYGVCRSLDFPGIILHGTIRDSVRRHCASLTVIQLLHFNIQLFDDLESASDYLSRLYHESPHGWTDDVYDGDLSNIYVNEQGRIMLAGFSFRYDLDNFFVEVIQNRKVCSKVILRYTREIFPDNLSTRDWNSLICRSPSLDKKHLIDVYDALYILMGCHISSYLCNLDVYSSGSVYTMATQYFPRDYLVVGKIPVLPTEQAVAWELDHTGRGQGRAGRRAGAEQGNSRTLFSGSFTIQYLSVQRQLITISSTEGLHSSEHSKRPRRMMHSLFAQASRLSSSSSQNLRDIDRRMHNMEYVGVLCSWPVTFELYFRPCYDPFQLLDTFMADSDYAFALSLTVCEPRLDPQSNTVSWPVIHWYCDLDLSNEISMEEVEALFGVKVSIYARGDLYEVLKKQLSTIVEINTMCGFDPALEGADICEYFDLPRMEIFKDPVEAIPKYKFKRTTLPMPVDDHKDTTDVTPLTHIRAEKEPSTSHTQKQLIGILIALNVLLLSLVIHYSITV